MVHEMLDNRGETGYVITALAKVVLGIKNFCREDRATAAHLAHNQDGVLSSTLGLATNL